MQETGTLARSRVGLLGSSNRVATGVGLWIRQEAQHGLPTPGGCCAQGPRAAVPCCCSRNLRSGSWFVATSLFLIIAPNAHVCSYFQSLMVSLYPTAPGGVCPGARTAVKGPRSQPVCKPPSAVLTTHSSTNMH